MRSPYPFVTQRLWQAHKNPTELGAVLALLQSHRGACDEVWFATDYGFPPLSVHRASAAAMAVAAERVRGLGIVASMQVSNTLGHGAYLKHLNFEGLTWQRMVGPDGQIAPYANCPRDPNFHAYLDAMIGAYAAWQPASVWIDDDLRMHHHSPIHYGCFCERCLAEFGVAGGRVWTREALVEAVGPANDLEIREAWLNFGRQSLAMVASVIAEAVHAVAPQCRLGLQHCDPAWGGYNGPDWSPIFGALARISRRPAGSRPGGGFYNDHAPREMLAKALYGELQNSRLPASVDDVRVEVENLPGSVMGKSAHGTAVEATLALASGSNGLTLTPLMFDHEELEWHGRVLGEVASWRPFWLRYLAASEGTRPAGLEIALSRRFTQRPIAPEEPPFAWAQPSLPALSPLLPLGLPLAWDAQPGRGVLLHPGTVDGMDEGELLALAARGVVTDGEALRRLLERGMGQVLPVSARPADGRDADVRFTDAALNGPYAGRTIGLSSLSRVFPAYVLHPSTAETHVLGHYARSDGTLGGPATVALQTALGGRWVIFGNGCWDGALTTAGRAQLLAAADWVSPDGLPVLLETPGQVAVFPRCDQEGRVCSVLLLNCSLDATATLSLRVRQPRGCHARWLAPQADAVDLPFSDALKLPALEAWHVGVLLFE